MNPLQAKKNTTTETLSRLLAAIVPGYVLTNTSAIFIGNLLPLVKAEAVFIVSMLSFVLYAVIIMWVFSDKSVKRVWLGLLLAITLTGTGSWLFHTPVSG